jgi:ribose transport system ATP-binding protein
VEIAKAVIGEFSVLILDEPTSALNLADTERLFKIVRRLKADGVAILYVSHRLCEVFDLADRVTVLRDGNRIFTTEISKTDVSAVIRAMLGSKSSLIARAGRPRTASSTPATRGGPTLELETVTSGDLLKDISVRVQEGEIIGLAGVIGSGRTELCEAIYGLRRIDSGVVRLGGAPAKLREPTASLRRGVFLLPEDRKSEGIFGHLDVRENVILAYNPAREELKQLEPTGSDSAGAASQQRSHSRRFGLGPIRSRAERQAFYRMRDSLSIRCTGPRERITALSGGNQQKALFARAALARPSVLLLSEPTRGVDVGAKEEIYSAIEAFARRGISVIVSSSEISELIRLASRIYVLRNGRVVAELASNETSEEEVLRQMAG